MKKTVVVLALLVSSLSSFAQAVEVCFIKTYKMSARSNLHLTCSGQPVQKIVDAVRSNSVNLTKKKAVVIRTLIQRGYRVESENMFIKY